MALFTPYDYIDQVNVKCELDKLPRMDNPYQPVFSRSEINMRLVNDIDTVNRNFHCFKLSKEDQFNKMIEARNDNCFKQIHIPNLLQTRPSYKVCNQIVDLNNDKIMNIDECKQDTMQNIFQNMESERKLLNMAKQTSKCGSGQYVPFNRFPNIDDPNKDQWMDGYQKQSGQCSFTPFSKLN
jgi:hypothetical protein